MGKSSENIFTAYKKAAEAVTRLELWQDKLTAWQMVADFCRDGGNCPLESKPAVLQTDAREMLDRKKEEFAALCRQD